MKKKQEKGQKQLLLTKDIMMGQRNEETLISGHLGASQTCHVSQAAGSSSKGERKKERGEEKKRRRRRIENFHQECGSR